MTKLQARKLLIKTAESKKYIVDGNLFYKCMCKIYNQIHGTNFKDGNFYNAPAEVVTFFFDAKHTTKGFSDGNSVNINGKGIGRITELNGLASAIELIKSCI
jgi:hypothetical protein